MAGKKSGTLPKHEKKLSWHKSELKQTHKIWKRISCFSAIIIIQKSLIFTTFSMLSETLQEEMKNEREKKTPESIMKSETCFPSDGADKEC